jgi:LicD family
MSNIIIATPQAYVDEFYNQLKILDEFFVKHKLKYWLIGGSLLGQVRSKSFIPWDEDNDVGILEKDGEYIFKHLRPSLKDHGLDIWHSVHGLKLFSTKLPHAGTDLFYYKFNNGIYQLASERSYQQWPYDYFLENEIHHLLRKPFGPITLHVPHNPERYLKIVYGQNCLTHARLNSYDHFTNGPRNCIITDIPLNQVILKPKENIPSP